MNAQRHFRAMFKFKLSQAKPGNVSRIFLIILFAIIADQTMENVLLEAIAPLDMAYGWVSDAFFFVSMPFSILLASWSDFYRRRQVMIFALVSMLLSGILTTLYEEFASNWIAFAALAFKGIGGNVTPIALASLATIVPPKKFTIFLAIAICGYSIGSWAPIYFRSFTHLALIATILSLFCTVIVIKLFREPEFDKPILTNDSFGIKKFFIFMRKELKVIALFILPIPILLAFSGFIFSEISFYQILLRGEVLTRDNFYSSLALRMAIGYYPGTIVLCILQNKKFPDAWCLKLGILISFLSILFLSALSYAPIEGTLIFDMLFIFFSFGYALITPSLFAILSKIKRLNEQGKIYGLLDSTDALSVLLATRFIKGYRITSHNNVLWTSLIIFFISAIFILSFIRSVKHVRRRDGP